METERKKLAIIRFWYEGNIHSPLVADKDLFQRREWISGPDAADFYEKSNVEPAAVADFQKIYPDAEVEFIFCTAAYPAGAMAAGLFDEIAQQVETGLAGHRWDGVYVSLHGAAVSQDTTFPEQTLLRRIRDIVGPVPVAVTLDLHANIGPWLEELADVVVAYKTYPHVDMKETAAKALGLLGRHMEGKISPAVLVRPAGFSPTSFNMRTDAGPMADVVSEAAVCEHKNGFYDVSAIGGFPYVDNPEAGATICICHEKGRVNVDSEAERLTGLFFDKADEFEVSLPEPGPLLEELAEGNDNGPVAVLEPSDNVFSGGAADTPGLFRAILDSRPERPVLFAFFWDPDLVTRAVAAGTGAVLSCSFGARLSNAFGSPVDADVIVDRLTEGRFVNDGPMEKGLVVELGPTAVLRLDEIFVIVTSCNAPVNDPAYFRLHDLNLDDFNLVCVKAKNHFRAAFRDTFAKIFEVDTPGPAALRPELLHQHRLRDATLDDAENIAALHTESWRGVYRGILPDAYLDNEIASERDRFWKNRLSGLPDNEMVLVLDSKEALEGFAWVEWGDEPGYDATIHALHITPHQHGSGFGKRLLSAACKRVKSGGGSSICLRVFDANTKAIGFYKHLGGIIDDHDIDPFAGANAPDSRVGWPDLTDLIRRTGG